jgi:hypothetical protein
VRAERRGRAALTEEDDAGASVLLVTSGSTRGDPAMAVVAKFDGESELGVARVTVMV